jgi:hypothetical protein
MARRRLSITPSREARREAFYEQTGGRPYGQLNISDRPMTVFGEIRWVVEGHIAASRKEPTREGAPPKLARIVAATYWLERAGVTLSDAPGSRCVKELVKFLEDWHARPGISPSTAETLAGTLIAYAREIVVSTQQISST